jgi:hypothetical protein
MNLNILNCRNNQITFLSLGNNLLIDTLYVHQNNLTELEISSNTGLVQVWCFENQITQIDLSSNILIEDFRCDNNNLNSLDLRNGNNTEMIVNLTDNPDLFCINVDDSQWSIENWFEIDTQHFFSEDCNMTSLDDLKLTNKFKISEFDLFGRKTNIKNQPVIEIYNDGSVEKKVIIE